MKPMFVSPVRERRSGIALMISIVALVLATGIVVGLVRRMVDRTRQVERQLWTLQAEMVADAIEDRVRKSLESGSDVATEDWSPPLPGSSGPTGNVTIVRKGSAEHPSYHIEVRVPSDETVPAIVIRDIAE